MCGLAMITMMLAVAARPTTHITERDRTSPDTTVSFANDILPLFERSCWECHGGKDENGEVYAEEELHLTTYEGVMVGSTSGPVIEPGDVGESFLYELVEFGDMPAEGDPLAPEEIALIKRWIEAGAPNN